MGTKIGHIELERSIESIIVGKRHRTEFGDIDELAESITRDGLLQPVTVTPEGVLVCGARRLEALKRLGEKTIKVWVRSGISDRLAELLAEQAENVLHKPLTPTEAAALYTELKDHIADDATRRQAATRFSRPDARDGKRRRCHRGTTAIQAGKSRTQAAQMVTGKASYTTLERIAELQRFVADPGADPALKERASEELRLIDEGGVSPRHTRESDNPRAGAAAAVRGLRSAQGLRAARRTRAIGECGSRESQGGQAQPPNVQVSCRCAHVFPVRAFVRVWEDLDLWWTHFDVAAVATELSDEQLEQFEATLASTVEFFAALRSARVQLGREIA